MSETTDLGTRLARHLSGAASEAEREALERQVLEDDPLFDQLEALESELVDAYVRGEMDHREGQGVARLMEVSTRTRAAADTTLALDLRHEQARVAAPAELEVAHGTVTEHRHAAGMRGWVGRIALLLTLFGLAWGWIHQAQVARALTAENAMLRQQAEARDARLARLEEAHRTLALRLARIEAEALP